MAEDVDVFLVRDVTPAHGTEVGCLELTVDHTAAKGTEQAGKMDESEFRGTGYQREHALAKERCAKVDPIESTHETIGSAVGLRLPHLDTRRKALTMELGIGFDDVRTKPSTVFSVTVLGRSATTDDASEILVDGERVWVLAEELLHGVTDMDFLGKDDKALLGTVPEGLVLGAEREPGEEAVGIGQYQTVDREVATYGYQSVIFTQRGVGKPQLIV